MKSENVGKTIQKAMDILNLFSRECPMLTLTEISNKVGIPKPTALRVLNTLIVNNILTRDELSKKYMLGAHLLYLSSIVLSRIDVRTVAIPVLREVRDRTGENVHLNTIIDGKRVCVECMKGFQSLQYTVQVGERTPLYAGASARLLLAFMEDQEREMTIDNLEIEAITEYTITDKARLREDIAKIRRQGFVVTYGERLKGVYSVSVPIMDRKGKVIAGLSIAIPEVRMDQNKLDEYIKILLAGSMQISQGLGYFKGNVQPPMEKA